jgi:hypothetical protein
MTESVTLMKRIREVPNDDIRAGNDKTAQDAQCAERRRVQDRIAWLCRHAGDGPANGLLRSVVEQYRMAGLS